MKKIIILASILILSFISFDSSFAATTSSSYSKIDNTMYKLYKKAILTRSQIKKDYLDGDKINNKIEKYFISLYSKSDRTKRLKEVEKKMWDLINKYDNKKLNAKQEKALNIIKNIYYRAVIDLRK